MSIGNSSFSVTLSLLAGDSLTHSISYLSRDIAPATINFSLDKSNLPAGGAEPLIALEGPEGYYLEVTDNILIEGLVPGEYRFYALDFSSQNELFGVYFNYGSHRLLEGWYLEESAIIRPVPIRVKSVSRLERSSLGLRDNEGNRYTIDAIFESTTKSY